MSVENGTFDSDWFCLSRISTSVGSSSSSSLSSAARVLHRGLAGVGASDVTLPTLKWVVDRTLSLTSGDTSGMINSNGRLLSVRTERSIAARPDRVVQRRDMPFLINASQRGFDCCG
ncbi:hypothetical protein GW17_00052779, partial [Ensete ventricosum]